MTGMDVFAAACFVIAVWGGVQYGRASERERQERRAADRADRIAARQAAIRDETARKAAAAANVVQLNTRRGRAS